MSVAVNSEYIVNGTGNRPVFVIHLLVVDGIYRDCKVNCVKE